MPQILQGASKGATVSSQVTASVVDADHNAMDVALPGVTLDTSAVAGNVGGYTVAKTFTITPDSLIYASGDLIGAKQTIANVARSSGKGVLLHALTVSDTASQKSALDIVLWAGADPATTTFTDQAAFDCSDADLLTCAGTVPVAADDYVDFADNALATVRNIGLPIVPTVTTLYAAVVCRGTPTYGAAQTIQVRLLFLQD